MYKHYPFHTKTAVVVVVCLQPLTLEHYERIMRIADEARQGDFGGCAH